MPDIRDRLQNALVQTVTFERETVLLYAHVAHSHTADELVDGQAAATLERIQYSEPLGSADFF